MRKQVWFATLVYVLSIAFCLGLMYLFMWDSGFNEENFLIIGGVIVILALGIGHILTTHLLAPKAHIDATLLELTDEIIHELNIPLSTIEANTTLLKKRVEDEKLLKRIERIEEASKRLQRLYKELVYGIKKELHPISKEIVVLDKLLKERVEIFKAFERNPFALELEPCSVRIDKIGFEKIIDNLLMNAMKYSPKTEPITVTLKDGILTIEDKGVGMDETHLLRVYERYYQADKKQAGEGIGLALVKNYCNEAGIEIQIQSQKDKGTKVVLHLGKVIHR
ncbi:MAG: HAMP domain-containing histidine kinase [Campylobacterales bacterium]|nr:HAMP domain-containing histidine kinase [Campylobacterales bacterium]